MTASIDPVRGEDAVRAALVKAAADLLGEVGASALSVREIARRAGVNHGQVHHYFGSKHALLAAAMRQLARTHFENSVGRARGGPIPPPLSLVDDPGYWRAVSRLVLDGDLDLARIEIDEDLSVPRRALHAMRERHAIPKGDLDFAARFAAVVALQLGWVAFEDFVLMLAEVDESDRDAVRDRLKNFLTSILPEVNPWTSD